MERRLLTSENTIPISNAVCNNIETRLSQKLTKEQRNQVHAVLVDQIRTCIRETRETGVTPVASAIQRKAAGETVRKVLPTFRFGHPALADTLRTPVRNE